ncbi:MAG: sensor domain-containing diguanylate cyclase [Spirochaetes bacterium]|nr:sensor domain-containing diguanylate cyclase [Spirochaetota bacterium]
MERETMKESPVPELVTSLEKKIYDLRNLIEIGMSLSSTLVFENLVESILYSCIGQMFVEKVAIILQVDIDIHNYYIHMSKGYDSEFDKDDVILMENSPLVAYFAKNSRPQGLGQLSRNEVFADDLRGFEKLEPEIFVPMVSKDTINGMLVLGPKIVGGSFTVDDLDFLRDLGRFAAIAVENSRLYQMATVDRMTRLYVHHFFLERLDEEIKRSQRYNAPLSLLMCDIDHFKNFNDTYGHQQGDTILRELGVLIRKCLRKMDIPARYGGEEFAIVLPETSLENAKKVASRMRRQVESFDFTGPGSPLHVTISIGVAEYRPDRNEEIRALVGRADRALYTAKKSGRNRVAAVR